MLNPNIEERPQSAAEVVQVLSDWLNGSKRSQDADEIVAQAEDVGMAANMAFEEAQNLRQTAQELEKTIPVWAPDSWKNKNCGNYRHSSKIWKLSPCKRSLQMEELLHGALTHDPKNTTANLLLAQRYQLAHKESESSRDVISSAYYGSRLQHHAEALPAQHPQRKKYAHLLEWSGPSVTQI